MAKRWPSNSPRKELAVEADVFVMARVGGDAVEVAIVVAEYDVDGPGKSAAQLVDHEGRAEIAAAQQYIGIAHAASAASSFQTLSWMSERMAILMSGAVYP